LNKQNGNSILTTPIIIAIGMMLIAMIIVFTVKIITPYIWYEKLSSTCIKYIFIMEEYGYLSKTEKNNLIDELDDNGFDSDKLQVNCTSSKKPYGEPIYLNVQYDYNLDLPNMENKTIVMRINRESVSKR
jgi:hypothetical protein